MPDKLPRLLNHLAFNWLYLTVAILLYLFFLFGHIPISNLCYALRDTYTETVYTHYIQLSGKILLAIQMLWLISRLTRPSMQYKKLIVWTLFAITLAFNYAQLILFAIEYVHFLQYAMFTIVMFFALNKYLFTTIIACILLGFLDEIYQAQHPDGPLNWRDISLNVIGVAWGCLLLWTEQLILNPTQQYNINISSH